jgi:4-hydroxy-tetrahydrodipicolinate synthase
MADYRREDAKDWARESMHGHWNTNITPFLSDGELDEAGIQQNVEHVLRLGTKGLGITWLTGEFWSLSTEERKRVCELTVKGVGGRAFVGVHTTHTSLKECVELTKHAEATGADLAILMPPYIIARTPGQVYDFFRRVAESTHLGIAIFNTPQSGLTLHPKDVVELAGIPNVCAVKVATQNVGDIVATHMAAGDRIVVSSAADEPFFYQEFYGFRQQVLFANPCDWMFDSPGEGHYVQFVEHACRGEMNEAAKIYRAKVHPLKAVFENWMRSLMEKYGGAYPSQMKKAWAELVGMAAGPVRSPLLPLTQEEKCRLTEDVAEARRKAGLAPVESHRR